MGFPAQSGHSALSSAVSSLAQAPDDDKCSLVPHTTTLAEGLANHYPFACLPLFLLGRVPLLVILTRLIKSLNLLTTGRAWILAEYAIYLDELLPGFICAHELL